MWPSDRAQSPRQQRRRDHGVGDGVPRQHRRAAEGNHDAGRDPAPERLQHGCVRQVSRDPPWEVSVSGPYDRWPTGSGFEKFYGFIGGETNQWAPAMFGNRGIYHDGWVACTRHSIPWLMVPLPPVKDDVWELYNVDEDFSEANNLAARIPRSSRSCRRSFLQRGRAQSRAADRRSPRPSASTRPSPDGPDLLHGRKIATVYPGMTGMMENAFINVKGVHHTITADVELTDDNTSGVIIAQAGYFGGWTLYMKDGKPHHEYNWFALERTNIGGETGACAGQAHDRLRIHTGRRGARHRRQVDSRRRRQDGSRSTDPEDAAVCVFRR